MSMKPARMALTLASVLCLIAVALATMALDHQSLARAFQPAPGAASAPPASLEPTPIVTPVATPPAWSRPASPVTYDVVIHSVSPQPPDCVFRSSSVAAERTLVIEGESFSTTAHNLQFMKVTTGETSIHFHMEVNWESTTRVTVDMDTIDHLLWSDPALSMRVRLTTYDGGTYVPVSEWSDIFYLADDADACQSIEPTPLPEPAVIPPPQEYWVFEIIFNPIIESEGGQTLIELKHWNNPQALDQQYIADLNTGAHGDVSYQIVESQQVDDIPQKKDGFDYTDSTYLACLQNPANCHFPDTVDYGKIFADFDICTKVLEDGISEVWLWGGPYFGYWEYSIRGPALNITPENIPLCGNKTVTVMGFNYERGSPEMLEDYGHRTEGVLSQQIAGGNWQQNEANEWNKYTLVAAPVSSYPYGHCGNIHYPPNGTSDYDWGNTRYVSSDCDDWLNYPDLTGTSVDLNCSAWGCNGYSYIKWWLRHLPHASGTTDGHLNDWWCYVTDYEAAFVTPYAPAGLAIHTAGSTDVALGWSDDDNTGYHVWQGTTPFFTPEDGQAGTQHLAITAEPSYIVHNATGDPGVNHYYFVQGANHCGHASEASSNRVGEFDYGLVPGLP
jgi:hypothetical protein